MLVTIDPCRNRHVIAIVGFAIANLWATSPTDAAVFANFDPSRHARFLDDGSPNPGFLIDESLISGVGVNSQTVLITPQHYLTAAHFADSTPTFRGADGVLRTYSTSGYIDLTTYLGVSAFTSDLRLYTLDEAIPDAHQVKPIALFNDEPANLLAQEFYIIGQGNQAGANVVDATTPATLGGGTRLSHTIFFTFDTATNGGTNPIADEAGLLGGDSGSAALIRVGDEVAVLGTHFGVSIPPGSSNHAGDRYNNFSTLATPYLSEIESVVAADGQSISTLSFSSVVAVPEPNCIVCLFAVTLAACRRRRR